ncbi:MAG TPA: c-type cytochrome biogenesis protein CcmF, partial [Thauera sp.]|nr:c-type cytochrome biogenesis protein CcmF [Thauera sp.]
PKRGLYILALLVLVIGFSLLLFAMRANKLMGGGSFALVSRETSLLGNNVLLTVASVSVLLGTLYPLFLDALNLGKISVGPPYFEAVFVPLMTPVVVLMMFGPFLRWKDDDFVAAARKVAPAFVASILIGIGAAMAVDHLTWRTALGLFLAAWVVLASIQLLHGRLKERAGASAGSRLRSITASWWGMWLAHLGVGVFIIGVTMVGSLEKQLDVKMQEGQRAELAGYTFTFRGAIDADGPNYDAARGIIDVTRNGRAIATLTPEKRLYWTQGMPMTEASIDIGPFRDVYVSLGEQLQDGAWIVSLYYKPFISWIWLGCTLMGLGGLFAAADRRYRRLAERDAKVGAGRSVAGAA